MVAHTEWDRRGRRLCIGDSLVCCKGDLIWVDCHTLGRVIGFVNPDQAVGEFEYVVPQRNNDKLRVPRTFLGKEENKKRVRERGGRKL